MNKFAEAGYAQALIDLGLVKDAGFFGNVAKRFTTGVKPKAAPALAAVPNPPPPAAMHPQSRPTGGAVRDDPRPQNSRESDLLNAYQTQPNPNWHKQTQPPARPQGMLPQKPQQPWKAPEVDPEVHAEFLRNQSASDRNFSTRRREGFLQGKSVGQIDTEEALSSFGNDPGFASLLSAQPKGVQPRGYNPWDGSTF
jgi:hypothetical protein